MGTREFSPVDLLCQSHRPPLPMLIARFGLEERPWLSPTLDRFVAEALHRNVEMMCSTTPSGHHAFGVLRREVTES